MDTDADDLRVYLVVQRVTVDRTIVVRAASKADARRRFVSEGEAVHDEPVRYQSPARCAVHEDTAGVQ